MTDTALPERAEVDETIKWIDDHAPATFLSDYQRDRDQLVTLYNKGMSSQWNSVTDLDWSIDVDPERLVATAKQPSAIVELARVAATVPGSPFASVAEKEVLDPGG